MPQAIIFLTTDGAVAIAADTLKLMVEESRILDQLLYGHEAMGDGRHQDAERSIFATFKASTRSLTMLVRAVRNARAWAPTESESISDQCIVELHELVIRLGGFPAVEAAIARHYARANAEKEAERLRHITEPHMDSYGEFDWRTLLSGNTDSINAWMTEGEATSFTHASIVILEGPHGSVNWMIHARRPVASRKRAREE